MKKSVMSLLLALCCVLYGFAQAQMPQIPIDPNVRIGKLDNGLTYYIRHNKLPENRADFYIAQKVGSIQETPEQSGLAHFLEHMCFNGTTNFPGKTLIEYLETIGVKFGVNLNAYTSIEETVYNISNVPVTRATTIDSCLLILHDWSNDLLLDGEEIDKERGVIQEEWRSRRSAMQRLQEKALPQMFAGTKYEDCMPIGHMEVVLNFEHQAIRDYYKKWYRPDLQAIVVVGDVDVDAVEEKIKTTFADIPAQPNGAERVYYPVGDNKEPIIVIEQDKEQSQIQVLLFNKHDVVPDEEKSSVNYMILYYMKSMISSMLNARLNELRQSPTPPFITASTSDQQFFVARTKDAFLGHAICKEEAIEEGVSALLHEIERARRFGFTESEYARARANFQRGLESQYNERDKTKNQQYVREYVRHFLDNEPIAGIEYEYTLFNQVADKIPVEAINQLLPTLISDTNKVVAIFGPEKERLVYPKKEAILQILNDVSKEELTPYADKVSDEPLISEMPTAGKIVSQKENAIFGTTELVLSNGVKVIIKPTDFKADEIMMHAVSLGGTSLHPDSEIINLKNMNSYVSAGGLGNFSRVDLNKVLAGKKASANTFINTLTEGISGSCSPADFETMMQLTYLSFTSPRRDEDAFLSQKNRNKASLENQELQPMVALIDTINSTLYMNHPRIFRMKAAMLDQLNYDRMFEMYKERFTDAGGFTFMLVGNVDVETVKPYIELYLGSLPATNKKETFKDTKEVMRPGIHRNVFSRRQETPKATNLVFYHGSMAYNLRNITQMSMLDQILDLVYTEKVREDEGGSYGVGVSGNIDKLPREEFALQIYFETSPEKRDKLMKIVFAEIEQLSTEGPSATNLNKVKEYMLKQHAEQLKENNYWMGAIDEYILNGLDIVDGYEALINSITTDDIRKFANEVFVKQKNEIEISMISPNEE